MNSCSKISLFFVRLLIWLAWSQKCATHRKKVTKKERQNRLFLENYCVFLNKTLRNRRYYKVHSTREVLLKGWRVVLITPKRVSIRHFFLWKISSGVLFRRKLTTRPFFSHHSFHKRSITFAMCYRRQTATWFTTCDLKKSMKKPKIRRAIVVQWHVEFWVFS